MEGKYIAGIAAIVVAVILVGSVLAPVIDTVSGGAWDETVTTTYNEDPDLTFDRLTSDFALDITVTFGDDISIVNGEDTITATFGPMFLLAADNSAVFINTADEIILVWTDTDGTQSVNLQGDFTAAIADDKLTIDDGTSYDLPLPTSYLYVPSSTGQYGSFPDGGLTKRAEDPVIAAGSFAGVVGYNTSVTLVGDAMQMEVVGNDTTITEVNWIAAVEELDPQMIDFDPGQITIQPLDPSIIDPEPDASIMAVPTPSYTDGDWGYDLIASGANQGKAKIVSYSGSAGGPITIPATVGGYAVAEVGKGGNGQTVFDTSLSVNGLIFSEGITHINNYAFSSCTNITGSLTLPDSLTSIGNFAFRYVHFTGSLIIPENVTTLGDNSFRSTTFDGVLVLPVSVTTIVDNSFDGTGFKSLVSSIDSGATIASDQYRAVFLNTSNLKEVLNLGTLELTTTSYGLNADTLQDYIGADCYIAPATITEVIHHSGGGGGGMGAMYAAIPVVILAAILLAAVSMFVIRRGM